MCDWCALFCDIFDALQRTLHTRTKAIKIKTNIIIIDVAHFWSFSLHTQNWICCHCPHRTQRHALRKNPHKMRHRSNDSEHDIYPLVNGIDRNCLHFISHLQLWPKVEKPQNPNNHNRIFEIQCNLNCTSCMEVWEALIMHGNTIFFSSKRFEIIVCMIFFCSSAHRYNKLPAQVNSILSTFTFNGFLNIILLTHM